MENTQHSIRARVTENFKYNKTNRLITIMKDYDKYLEFAGCLSLNKFGRSFPILETGCLKTDTRPPSLE